MQVDPTGIDCRSIAHELTAELDGEAISEANMAHIESCLACQADRIRYRRVQTVLSSLRSWEVFPDPELLPTVLNSLAEMGPPWGSRPVRKAAYLGGLAAAAGAGALVIATRHRRLAS